MGKSKWALAHGLPLQAFKLHPLCNTLEVEMDIALTGLSLQSALIGHHEVAQAVNHVVEDIGGNDAITQ
jgi:hypothetical protein